MTCSIKENDLAHFTGSQQMYQHWTGAMIYTEGVGYLIGNGAAWLVDAIASYQIDDTIRKNPGLQYFQLWQLEVSDGEGVLTCREDSDTPAVVSQDITYTDFQFNIKLYVERGSIDGVNECMVCMLPSER